MSLKRTPSSEELAPTSLTVTLSAHIVRDLKEMEKNTKQTVDQLVSKAVLMFIATHSNYLSGSKG